MEVGRPYDICKQITMLLKGNHGQNWGPCNIKNESLGSPEMVTGDNRVFFAIFFCAMPVGFVFRFKY